MSPATQDDLKPCPFCGGKAMLIHQKEFGGWDCHGIECIECEASAQPQQIDSRRSQLQFLYPEQSAQDAIAAWNARVK